jgi:hypothetical protein
MMTDQEWEALQSECREYIRRTSFPPSHDDDEREYSHNEHAEFEAARH